MLKINKVSVSYETQKALDNVSISFEAGQINGLIGPNGAGKSSLLKTCCGLIARFDGDVIFNERNLRDNRFWVKQNVAYVPETAQLLPYLTGLEFLKLIAGLYNLTNIEKSIDFFSSMLDLNEKLDQLINTYSHGMMQKLSLAAALLPELPFVLIDEALNGLDSIALKRVKTYLDDRKEKGTHVIVSSHQIELIARWCDTVYVIDQGSILGTLVQNKEAKSLLTQYLDLLDKERNPRT